MVPRGLINTGNMCFANTILQVLVYCPPFTELFEELGKRLKADLARKTPLLEAITDARLKEARKEAFVPENVYDAMKENKRFDSMRRGHQEDAEEYLGFFLNTLHEELLYLLSRTSPPKPQPLLNGSASASPEDEVSIQRPVSPDAETAGDGWLEVGKKQKTNVVRATETRESAITRLFGGTIRSILTTPGMKNSVTLEPYQPLQLDIQSSDILSITDALRHLSQPEIVPGVWSASRKANVDATKQMTVETFPRVLILHLKRFVFEMGEMSVVKKSKPVAYGTELVIPPEIISPGRRGAPVKYRLFGVVYHHGYSAGGGHYTVAVSRPDVPASAASQWIHFDDETVSAVPTEQVVVSEQEAEEVRDGKAREGNLSIAGRERCAYLLFYQRVRA
ncbi:cysteine proteinase [Papiliotrema laurentii]|uniref:ubiquitinyl hydrolase 1 n=1 Tax=Papiliotrema laurentii TaxID=5418 RepID=A0AAD9FU76_PAPLA|nr:cysteine proteinase [Papiliotrema laurentii]